MKADVLKEFDVVHISNPIATTRALNGRRRILPSSTLLQSSSILFMTSLGFYIASSDILYVHVTGHFFTDKGMVSL